MFLRISPVRKISVCRYIAHFMLLLDFPQGEGITPLQIPSLVTVSPPPFKSDANRGRIRSL